MRAMTTPSRSTTDLDQLTPEALAHMPEREFRQVVTADMRRDASNERIRQNVPAWISDALRTTHVERWVATLHAMLANVEGQIALKQNALEEAKAKGGPGLDDAIAKHHQDLRSPLRFRSALLETLPDAERLHKGRVHTLEAAIRAHRKATLADLEIEPSPVDHGLWALLDD
jgi:hypothetical protein